MSKHSHLIRFSGPSLVTLLMLVPSGNTSGAEPLRSRVRQPVALVWADAGKTVLVANHRSGSISVIDAFTRRSWRNPTSAAVWPIW